MGEKRTQPREEVALDTHGLASRTILHPDMLANTGSRLASDDMRAMDCALMQNGAPVDAAQQVGRGAHSRSLVPLEIAEKVPVISRGERLPQIAATACPALNLDGMVTGSVGISVPLHRRRIGALSHRAMVELVDIPGHDALVAMASNVFGIGLPEAFAPDLGAVPGERMEG